MIAAVMMCDEVTTTVRREVQKKKRSMSQVRFSDDIDNTCTHITYLAKLKSYELVPRYV